MWTNFVIKLASRRLRFFGHCDSNSGGGSGHCGLSDYERGYQDGRRASGYGHCY